MKKLFGSSLAFLRFPLLLGLCSLPFYSDAGEDGAAQAVSDSGMTVLRSEAVRNWKKGRAADALGKLEVMAEEQPDEAQHRLAIGLCLRQQKRYSEALESYQDAKALGGPAGLIALLEAEVHGLRNEREQVFASLRRAAQGGRNIIKDVQELPALAPYGSDTGFVQLALELESFELPRLSGRDPFSEPFPLSTPEEPKELRKAPAVEAPEGGISQAEAVSRLRGLSAKVFEALSNGDESGALAAWVKIEKSGIEEVAFSLPRHRKEYRDIQSRLVAQGSRLKPVRLKYHYREAVAGLAGMQASFDSGDYREAEELSQAVFADTGKLKALAAEYAPVASELRRRTAELVRRTAIRVEFEGKKPSVKGILIGGGRGLAVVDGKPLRPGDSISEFLLLEVASDRVKFEYKGEEIPVYLTGGRDNN